MTVIVRAPGRGSQERMLLIYTTEYKQFDKIFSKEKLLLGNVNFSCQEFFEKIIFMI